eukprot:gene3638-2573_t
MRLFSLWYKIVYSYANASLFLVFSPSSSPPPYFSVFVYLSVYGYGVVLQIVSHRCAFLSHPYRQTHSALSHLFFFFSFVFFFLFIFEIYFFHIGVHKIFLFCWLVNKRRFFVGLLWIRPFRPPLKTPTGVARHFGSAGHVAVWNTHILNYIISQSNSQETRASFYRAFSGDENHPSFSLAAHRPPYRLPLSRIIHLAVSPGKLRAKDIIIIIIVVVVAVVFAPMHVKSLSFHTAALLLVLLLAACALTAPPAAARAITVLDLAGGNTETEQAVDYAAGAKAAFEHLGDLPNGDTISLVTVPSTGDVETIADQVNEQITLHPNVQAAVGPVDDVFYLVLEKNGAFRRSKLTMYGPLVISSAGREFTQQGVFVDLHPYGLIQAMKHYRDPLGRFNTLLVVVLDDTGAFTKTAAQLYAQIRDDTYGMCVIIADDVVWDELMGRIHAFNPVYMVVVGPAGNSKTTEFFHYVVTDETFVQEDKLQLYIPVGLAPDLIAVYNSEAIGASTKVLNNKNIFVIGPYPLATDTSNAAIVEAVKDLKTAGFPTTNLMRTAFALQGWFAANVVYGSLAQFGNSKDSSKSLYEDFFSQSSVVVDSDMFFGYYSGACDNALVSQQVTCWCNEGVKNGYRYGIAMDAAGKTYDFADVDTLPLELNGGDPVGCYRYTFSDPGEDGSGFYPDGDDDGESDRGDDNRSSSKWWIWLLVALLILLLLCLLIFLICYCCCSPVAAKKTKNAPVAGEVATFIYCDVLFGSELWCDYPEEMRKAARLYHTTTRKLISKYDCYEVETFRDRFFIASRSPKKAVKLVDELQKYLIKSSHGNIQIINEYYDEREKSAPQTMVVSKNEETASKDDKNKPFGGLRVQIGVHTGYCKVERNPYGYYYKGRAPKVAHESQKVSKGGQTLLTAATVYAMKPKESSSFTLRDRYSHEFRSCYYPASLIELYSVKDRRFRAVKPLAGLSTAIAMRERFKEYEIQDIDNASRELLGRLYSVFEEKTCQKRLMESNQYYVIVRPDEPVTTEQKTPPVMLDRISTRIAPIVYLYRSRREMIFEEPLDEDAPCAVQIIRQSHIRLFHGNSSSRGPSPQPSAIKKRGGEVIPLPGGPTANPLACGPTPNDFQFTYAGYANSNVQCLDGFELEYDDKREIFEGRVEVPPLATVRVWQGDVKGYHVSYMATRA